MSNRSKTFIRIREVMDRSGLSRSTIYQKIQDGTFPKQVILGEGARAVGWIESEVDAWVTEQIQTSRLDAIAVMPASPQLETAASNTRATNRGSRNHVIAGGQ